MPGRASSTSCGRTSTSPIAAHWEEVARAHGEVFRDVRPAATCVVAALLDPAWKVEIEAEAVLP